MRFSIWMVLLLFFAAGCGPDAGSRRVVILGFDGVEPLIVDQMLAEGHLPNLQQLKTQGGYQRLRSSLPPQSPSAWTTFATCQNPGAHGIYDYIGRDLKTYTPMMGVGLTVPPQVLPDGEWLKGPKSISFRSGQPFWVTADKQGRRSKLLQIPFAFPPDELDHGLMLCGAGVPDIGGYTTNFCSISDAFTPEELAEPVSGGVRIAVNFQEDKATIQVPGALDPLKPDLSTRIPVPLEIAVDRQARSVRFGVQGKEITVPERGWSEWVDWTLPVTEQHATRAISAFYVLEAGDRVNIYMSSLQYHPREPFVRYTTPAAYSGELADRLGLYKTLGWSHDTNALRKNALDDDAFLEEAKAHDVWLQELLRDEMRRGEYDVLVAVWTSMDRISHTFWRFRDPDHPLYTAEGAAKYGQVVEESYERMDGVVGEVMGSLAPEDLLLVLSDHGFHSFRTGFSVNTWLLRNGYLVLQGQTDAATAFVEDSGDMLQSVDWSKTRAYALGLGAVYLNIRGREGQGIVDPADVAGLSTELRDKLLAVTDPSTGSKIFTSVFGSDVFKGARRSSAPDLQLGYAEGYQTSKISAKGGIPREVFEPNLDKWSGEHASSDPESTPGILFSSKPLAKDPAIEDLGVTTLRYLGLDVPEEYEGKDLLAEGAN